MNRMVSIVALIAAVLCICLAGQMHPRLLQMRRDYRLNLAEPLENTPPLVAFTTVAMGGFRGIIADILWIRAAQLQQEGKYFELVQLADWITKLEPRFAPAWAFQGWNMAYNVSVMLDDPADRWRWVSHGIQLLRDHGLLYNPGDPILYRELGWLFQHKMGALLDQAHGYYKHAWAREMMTLFNGPQPDYKACAAAARSEAELLKRPGVSELVAQIRAQGQDPFSDSLLDKRNLPVALRDLLGDTPVVRELLLFLRVRRMTTIYKLDPQLMQKVDAEYGPLDWRLPEAHAIYWAWRGLPYARSNFEKISLERMVFQSMAEAFWTGRLFVSPEGDVYIPSPNLELLPRVDHAYVKASEEHPTEATVKTAHRNFLINAITTLYSFNRITEAHDVFDELRARYPESVRQRQFDQFIYETTITKTEDLDPNDARAMVEGAWYQSYFWLAAGDEGRAAGYNQLALFTWQQYMGRLKDEQHRERVGLPPPEQIRREAFDRVLEYFRQNPAAHERLLKAAPPK